MVKGEPPPPVWFFFFLAPLQVLIPSILACHRQCWGTPGSRESVPGGQNQGIDRKSPLCKDGLRRRAGPGAVWWWWRGRFRICPDGVWVLPSLHTSWASSPHCSEPVCYFFLSSFLINLFWNGPHAYVTASLLFWSAYSSVALRRFPLWCICHHCPSPDLFYLPSMKLYPR